MTGSVLASISHTAEIEWLVTPSHCTHVYTVLHGIDLVAHSWLAINFVVHSDVAGKPAVKPFDTF